MAAFFHGVSINESNIGPQPVRTTPSAVIGLVGSAPSWLVASPAVAAPLNTPTLVSSQVDAAKFGPLIQGYSIPYALAAIQQQNLGKGFGQVIVVNVFNPATHNTAVVATAFAMPASGPQVVNLGHMGILGPGLPGFTGATTVVVTNSAATTTYVEGTDYAVDYINGLVTGKSGGSITAGEALKIAFSYCDPSKVADPDIIGAVTGGAYTGLQALQLAYGTIGFFPSMLVAPGYSKDETVAAAMDSLSYKIYARALVDGVPATTVAATIANRGTVGNVFDTSSKRTVLCAPGADFTDTGIIPTGVTVSAAGTAAQNSANVTADSPFSQWVAGVWAAAILQYGFWESPSNKAIIGVIGPDVAMYASPFDAGADTNTLNAQGIVTIFDAFGTGNRVWGNRSAAYPTSTAPDNFVAIRMAMDVIEQTVQLTSMQYLDGPITNADITTVLQAVNSYLRSLVQQGGLVGNPQATFNPAENPASQLAAGQLVLDLDVMPPPPMERLTWNVMIDTSQLASLTASQSAQASGVIAS